MNKRVRRSLAVALLLLFCVTTTKEARADSLGRDVALVFVGVVVATAAITVGIIYAVRHNPSLKGCVSESPSGLQIQNEGDSRTWALLGDTSKIKTGDRVRVSGKKKKVKDGEPPQLIVEKFGKDYGACHAQTATP